MASDDQVGTLGFSNEPLRSHDLPVLTDEEFVPVDPKYLRVSLAMMAIFATVVAIVGVILAIVVPGSPWFPLAICGGVLLLLMLAAAARTAEVRHIAYQVREHDLSYRSGVIFKTVATIPFVRVQHARVHSGPIERWFGLTTLEVNSAGPDVHIHGLATDDAARLKALVVERAGDLDESS